MLRTFQTTRHTNKHLGTHTHVGTVACITKTVECTALLIRIRKGKTSSFWPHTVFLSRKSYECGFRYYKFLEFLLTCSLRVKSVCSSEGDSLCFVRELADSSCTHSSLILTSFGYKRFELLNKTWSLLTSTELHTLLALHTNIHFELHQFSDR